MREPIGYRECIEWLNDATDGKGWLSTSEIARVLGVSREMVITRFGIRKGCAVPMLALKLAQESGG